ncbi:MAG: L-serine ammonia-lyase, iron-sulfur-dependent, subunit alpha [Lachnospiraceae bacterium]
MFESLSEIVLRTKENQCSFYQVVLEDDAREQGISISESFERMQKMLLAMRAADQNYDPTLYSSSHLVGTDGARIENARKENNLLCGSFIGKVMEKAVKMGESNACMKRIVAAPTAGACGVIPAVLLSLQEEKHYSDEKMIESLYVAAGIGGVIAKRAFISGAAGGCQAEIGSASAMAAGAIVFLRDGDAETMIQASAIALKNLLGLVCDPVAGLVEIPCVKRNVIGAVNALTSADLAMAGINSRIPPDEVIDAMRSVGKSIPEALRETGMGGLAATETGEKIAKEL